MNKVINRRRGVAIMETERGILLVSKKTRYGFPGGGAHENETREQAAVRELKEETGLIVQRIKYLFSDNERRPHEHKGRLIKNHAKVFLVKARGIPRPKNEIKDVRFWRPGSRLPLKDTTKRILNKYLKRTKKKEKISNL